LVAIAIWVGEAWEGGAGVAGVTFGGGTDGWGWIVGVGTGTSAGAGVSAGTFAVSGGFLCFMTSGQHPARTNMPETAATKIQYLISTSLAVPGLTS